MVCTSLTKVTGKSEVCPITGCKGLRGGVQMQIYSFLNTGTRQRYVINATPKPLYRQ
jgi:hypothetical protein